MQGRVLAHTVQAILAAIAVETLPPLVITAAGTGLRYFGRGLQDVGGVVEETGDNLLEIGADMRTRGRNNLRNRDFSAESCRHIQVGAKSVPLVH